jgi:flagellar motor switch protein FliN
MPAGFIRAAETPLREEPPTQKGSGPAPINGELLRAMRVTLEARLGRAEMTVEELMALKSGSVVSLEAGLADHLDLYLNGTLVARGVIVAVGDKFGVRIVEVGSAS